MEYLSRFCQQRSGQIHLFNSEREQINFEKDLQYLKLMKEMDCDIMEKVSKGNAEMEALRITEVVPVAGLIQARFSIIFCELQTVLELWGPKHVVDEGTLLGFPPHCCIFWKRNIISNLFK
jgi:hypothetical protein